MKEPLTFPGPVQNESLLEQECLDKLALSRSKRNNKDNSNNNNDTVIDNNTNNKSNNNNKNKYHRYWIYPPSDDPFLPIARFYTKMRDFVLVYSSLWNHLMDW